jgi:hypothetical protein
LKLWFLLFPRLLNLWEILQEFKFRYIKSVWEGTGV